jgi:hypothetical protein
MFPVESKALAERSVFGRVLRRARIALLRRMRAFPRNRPPESLVIWHWLTEAQLTPNPVRIHHQILLWQVGRPKMRR